MSEPAALHSTKSDYTYTRLREGVLSGEFAPGTVLNQAGLAKAIGISTTPLREALRRLKQQGLVELDAHRDARVTPLDAEEARDLLEVRRSLDPHRRYHSAIYGASHNALLVETLDGLWDTADRYRRHGLQVERSAEERAVTAPEHTLLFEAIVEGVGAT